MSVDGPMYQAPNGSPSVIELGERFAEIECRLAALEAAVKPAAQSGPWKPTIGRLARMRNGRRAMPVAELPEPLFGGETIIGWHIDRDGDRLSCTWLGDGRSLPLKESVLDLVADWTEADERAVSE